MYYVYIIKSAEKNWVYIGCTGNVQKRLTQHNNGRVRSTKAYVPFTLLGYEIYSDKNTARKRELILKRNSQQRELLYKKQKIS